MELTAMNTKFPTRARMDERLVLALPVDEKRKLFEVAAKRGTTVSAMVRAAVASFATQTAA